MKRWDRLHAFLPIIAVHAALLAILAGGWPFSPAANAIRAICN
jgi:hypothetical protein